MPGSLEDLQLAARFLGRLPGFLRHPLSLDEARGILRRRLERRETDLLTLLRDTVFRDPGSPYRALLRAVGCEYGDLETLVTHDGVEGALRTLARQGVYLTVDEFKGKRPVVRGGTTITVHPARLYNPQARPHVAARSSGSRSAGTIADVDLEFVRDLAVNHCLVLHARGGAGWRHAIWSVPGSLAIKWLLWLAGFGARPTRWFSPVDPAAPSLHPRYRWSARAVRWGSLLAGIPLPAPVHVPLSDPTPILRWASDAVGARETPHIATVVSAAVRLCEAARTAGVDLGGVQLTMTGEPITGARLAAVQRAGARAVPQYGASEAGGTIGHGCLAPVETDDVHLFHDLRAVVQPDSTEADSGLPASALLLTSLRPTTPLVLLNVSLGDHAVVVRRSCGCPLERLGWTTHLHTIRSHEKLTAGGIRLYDTDVVRVLEEVLPRRFGGGPTDYQLVEEEVEHGHPRLRLLVNPSIGPLDVDAAARVLVEAMGSGSGAERVVRLLWEDSGLLRVERRRPERSHGGKILHVHAGGSPAGVMGARGDPGPGEVRGR